jgi:hypothetical protein
MVSLASQSILFSSGLHVEVNTSRNYHNINKELRTEIFATFKLFCSLVLWYGDFFGYGLHDDDVLALGGLFSSYCGGLSCCFCYFIGKAFYLLISFVIQAQG